LSNICHNFILLGRGPPKSMCYTSDNMLQAVTVTKDIHKIGDACYIRFTHVNIIASASCSSFAHYPTGRQWHWLSLNITCPCIGAQHNFLHSSGLVRCVRNHEIAFLTTFGQLFDIFWQLLTTFWQFLTTFWQLFFFFFWCC
jgi:hypothetical protein